MPVRMSYAWPYDVCYMSRCSFCSAPDMPTFHPGRDSFAGAAGSLLRDWHDMPIVALLAATW